MRLCAGLKEREQMRVLTAQQAVEKRLSEDVASEIGRGPKSKNGQIKKILRIQLGLYIRKPGEKSLTQKKLILMRGIALEKNGPCSWENEVKISKKRKMAKNHFSRSYFGS